jgi:molybdate transport system regulatory protein
VNLSIRFRVEFAENSNIGRGQIELLEAIEKWGSLSKAARSMTMSYRHAWQLLESLNRTFEKRVTINSVGGRGGGGAAVTDFGRTVIEGFRGFEHRIRGIGTECFQAILPEVSDSPLVTIRRSRRIL